MLVKQGLCSKVHVVDKLLPTMAFLSPEAKEAFEVPLVVFKQAKLSSQSGIDKAFEAGPFDFVFNLTYDSITSGQGDDVYQQLIVDVSTRAAMKAKQQGVKCFVELSTAQVYEPNDKASSETGSKLKPWTKQATFKLRAEATLRDIPGLPLVVLRTATMYGPGDTSGLSPRILCAAVYRHLGEKMKFAWDGKLRANTVRFAKPPRHHPYPTAAHKLPIRHFSYHHGLG